MTRYTPNRRVVGFIVVMVMTVSLVTRGMITSMAKPETIRSTAEQGTTIYGEKQEMTYSMAAQEKIC